MSECQNGRRGRASSRAGAQEPHRALAVGGDRVLTSDHDIGEASVFAHIPQRLADAPCPNLRRMCKRHAHVGLVSPGSAALRSGARRVMLTMVQAQSEATAMLRGLAAPPRRMARWCAPCAEMALMDGAAAGRRADRKQLAAC